MNSDSIEPLKCHLFMAQLTRSLLTGSFGPITSFFASYNDIGINDHCLLHRFTRDTLKIQSSSLILHNLIWYTKVAIEKFYKKYD